MPAFRVLSIAVAILFVPLWPEAAQSQAVKQVGSIKKYKAVPHAKFRAKRAAKFGLMRSRRLRRGYLGLGVPIVAGIYVPPGTVLPRYWIFPRPYARWNFYRHTGWQQRIGLWSSHLTPGPLRSDDEFYKPVPGIKTTLRPSRLVTRNQWLSPTNWRSRTQW